jgi:hypothetical protein
MILHAKSGMLLPSARSPFLHHPIQHSRNRHSQQHIDHIMRLYVHGCDDDADARQQKYAKVHRLKAPRVRKREQGEGYLAMTGGKRGQRLSSLLKYSCPSFEVAHSGSYKARAVWV